MQILNHWVPMMDLSGSVTDVEMIDEQDSPVVDDIVMKFLNVAGHPLYSLVVK